MAFFWMQYTDLSSNFGYHKHDTDELVLVLKGEVFVYTDNSCFTQKAPCCIFFRKGKYHDQVNKGIEYERYCFQFDRSFTYNVFLDYSLFLRHENDDSFCIQLEEDMAQRLSCVAESMRLIYNDDYMEDIRLKLLFSYIICELSDTANRTINYRTSDYSCDSYMHIILNYIETNLSGKLTLRSVAERFKVSKTKLTRDFRKYLSVSFSEYVTMQRMNKARRMLFEGQELADVSEACGYNDSSYFVKVFKKYVKTTPAQYRRRFGKI